MLSSDSVGTVYFLLFSSLNSERLEAKPGRPEFRGAIGTCTSFYIASSWSFLS